LLFNSKITLEKFQVRYSAFCFTQNRFVKFCQLTSIKVPGNQRYFFINPLRIRQRVAAGFKLRVEIRGSLEWFLPRYMQCRRGLAMRILSVRPSACQTRGLWQNGRKICPDFCTIRKII